MRTWYVRAAAGPRAVGWVVGLASMSASRVRAHGLPYAPPVRPRLPHVLAAAVVLDATGRHVLLARDQDRPRWVLVAGHVEGGEQLAEAARRQVVEQAGITRFRVHEPHLALQQDLVECREGGEGQVRHIEHVFRWWSMPRSRCTTGRTTGTAAPRGSASATCRATSPLGLRCTWGRPCGRSRAADARRSSAGDLGVRLRGRRSVVRQDVADRVDAGARVEGERSADDT